jgi:arabinogalactan endo-1,4-beta-galactosidase
MVDGPMYPVAAPGVTLGPQFDTMVASGVESVRVVFDWSFAQPYRSWSDVPVADISQFTDVDGIPTRFSEMDAIVAAAASHGMTVLPVVLYPPGWDTAPHPASSSGRPRSPAPFANFVSALVHRYGPHGTFWQTQSPAVPIRMWQIWNEPNLTAYWPDQPYQRPYIKLLQASYQAIKRADPGAKVVLAGLTNYSWSQLRRIISTDNASRWFDVVALHPYTKQPEGVITILQKARQVLDAAGDQGKQIIADEVGWPSSRGETNQNGRLDFVTSEAGQARNVAQLLPLLGRYRTSLKLLGFYYYTWATIENRNESPFDYAGLEKYDAATNIFSAKPALAAFTHASLALEHCARKVGIASVCAAP